MAKHDDITQDASFANAELIVCLRESRAFVDFPAEDLSAFAALGEVLSFELGHVLLTEGADSSLFYVLIRGQVSIQIESISPAMEIGIAKLGPGEIIGEGTLLAKNARSATAVMMQDGVVGCFHPEPVLQMLKERPLVAARFYRNIATVLAARQRLTDRRLLNLTRSQFFPS